MQRNVVLSAFALLALSISGANAAGITNSNTQLNLALGTVSGSYSGNGIQGSVSAMPAIDAEYEIFSASTKSSFLLQGTLGYNSSQGQIPYANMGVGWRYYFKSVGMAYDMTNGGDHLASVPTWRYYADLNVGFTDIIAKTVTSVLSINSSLLEGGANIGAIYQISRNMGIDARLGMSYGMGFSSIALGGTTTKIFLGVSCFL